MTLSSEYKIQVAPSILAADFAKLGEQVKQVEQAGAGMIHIDVMDGRFVPNITMGALVVEALRPITELPLDVHLMIIEPERHIDDFIQAGADRITIHLEATPNVHRALLQIREAERRAGIALNPHTPAAALIDLMPFLDNINVMTVNPGYGGQEFLPEMMPKVARLRAMIGETRRRIDLQVDGGVNLETAMTSAQAGANILIVGSYVFQPAESIEHSMNSLLQVLQR